MLWARAGVPAQYLPSRPEEFGPDASAPGMINSLNRNVSAPTRVVPGRVDTLKQLEMVVAERGKLSQHGQGPVSDDDAARLRERLLVSRPIDRTSLSASVSQLRRSCEK